MIEIINRRPAYTDEMMLNYCNILDSVVSKTKKINKGRGRSAVMVDVPVHSFPDEVKQRTTKIKICLNLETTKRKS